ncbi:MAG: hypothetical protein ACTSWY_11220, partial [Promethearchaeota archaeon]
MKVKELLISFKKSIKVGFAYFHIGIFEILYILFCVFIYPRPTFYILDGMYYYAQLVSLFEDGDLFLYNNLRSFPLEIYEVTNQWSIGPAIFWTPFFLASRLLLLLIEIFLPSYYKLYPYNYLKFGIDIIFINLATIFYCYVGLK